MIWGCHYFWKHQFSWLTQGFPYMKIDCFRSLGQFFLTAMAKKTCGCELKVSFFQMNMDMKFHMSTWPKFKQTHGKPLLESHCISQQENNFEPTRLYLSQRGTAHTHTYTINDLEDKFGVAQLDLDTFTYTDPSVTDVIPDAQSVTTASLHSHILNNRLPSLTEGRSARDLPKQHREKSSPALIPQLEALATVEEIMVCALTYSRYFSCQLCWSRFPAHLRPQNQKPGRGFKSKEYNPMRFTKAFENFAVWRLEDHAN